LALYTALTLALTHPLALNLTTAVPNDIGDPLLNTWILAWDAHALLADPLNLFNANIFYPLPNTLAFSEHLFSTALLALPLQLITAEPVAAYNLSLLASFPLAAFGMYLLALRLTRYRRAAFVAGLLFGFAPYRFAAVAHLQLLTFQWLPFALLFLDWLIAAAPTHRRIIAATLFLTLQLWAAWYLAVYTGLIVGVYILAALVARRLPPARLPGVIAPVLLAAILTLPLALPYLPLVGALRAARPLSLAVSLAAAPTDIAAAAPFNRLFGPLTAALRARPHFTEENTLFLGLIGPALALAGLAIGLTRVRRHAANPHNQPRETVSAAVPALLIILVLALLLMLPGPYALLAHLFPPGTVVRVPPRWLIPALFGLAGLAGFGYARINEQFSMLNYQLSIFNFQCSIFNFQFSTKSIFFGVCVALIVAESFSVPLPLAPAENRVALAPAYRRLAGQSSRFALLELPLHSAPAPEYPEVKRLHASTLGWWPLVNGYSGYTPPRQPQLAAALANFPAPESVAALQQLNTPLPLLLLVHPGEAPFDRAAWETTARWQAQRQPALWPLGDFAGDYLYRVLPREQTQFTGKPLAVFGDSPSIRLLAFKLSGLPFDTDTSPPEFILQPSSFILLYWQIDAPAAQNPTVFIHLRAADGFVRSQADGPPVSGHYPAANWLPGQVVQDIHPLPPEDWAQVDHLAVGLYNPATGERLPAFGPTGSPLPNEALVIPLK
jgi:hypothetical protein